MKLLSGKSDRPSLVFIAYNASLDIFVIVVDAIVITGNVICPFNEESKYSFG